MTGTQLQALELIASLARTGDLRLTVVGPTSEPGEAGRALARMEGVELVTRAEIERRRRADLVHRPYQVDTDSDLAFLGGLAERLVVTNQDLIAYHNPAYFPTFAEWASYRRVTRAALAVADRVVFFSAHGRAEALEEELLDPGRASVVHTGVDHAFVRGAPAPSPPTHGERLAPGEEAILCLGTDFRHKNRLFALRVAQALKRRHGWAGTLVFAGPHVAHGSSLADETALLSRDPSLADAVLDLRALSEAEKAWLFERAALVLYPSVYEGFGLVPFEAAERDVPCMWARGTSLSEVLPDSAAWIVPWDAEQSAARALELLRDPSARRQNLDAIRAAAKPLTWDAAAASLSELYRQTCDEPAAPAGALERRRGMLLPFSDDALRLVGPGGALPSELERPLLALATHPHVGRPLFGALKAGYRASYRLRRLRGRYGSP